MAKNELIKDSVFYNDSKANASAAVRVRVWGAAWVQGRHRQQVPHLLDSRVFEKEFLKFSTFLPKKH